MGIIKATVTVAEAKALTFNDRPEWAEPKKDEAHRPERTTPLSGSPLYDRLPQQ